MRAAETCSNCGRGFIVAKSHLCASCDKQQREENAPYKGNGTHGAALVDRYEEGEERRMFQAHTLG